MFERVFSIPSLTHSLAHSLTSNHRYEKHRKEKEERERRLFEADLKEKRLAAEAATAKEDGENKEPQHHKINLAKLGLDPTKLMHGVGVQHGIPGRSHRSSSGEDGSKVVKSKVEQVQSSEALMNRATPAKKKRRRPQKKKFTPMKS